MPNQSFKYIVIALVVATLGLAVVAILRPHGVEPAPAQLAASRGAEAQANRGTSDGRSGGSNGAQSSPADASVQGARDAAASQQPGSPADGAPGGAPGEGPDGADPVIGSGVPLPGGGSRGVPGSPGFDNDGNPWPTQYRPGAEGDSPESSLGKDSSWKDAEGAGAEDDGGTAEDTEPTPTETPSPEQATLGGRVVRGETGVTDAHLELTADGFWKEVQSDASGSYYFPPLEPGDYTLRLIYPATPLPQRMISLAAGESNSSEDFVIPELPPITGQIVNDETGQGVPAAAVSVWQGEKGIGEVRGGQDGGFQLFPLDPGSYTLKVLASGFRPGDTSLEVSENSNLNQPVQIRLTPAVTLSGRVVDEAGQAINGALVALFSAGSVYGGPYASQPFQKTQAGGLFLFSSLPEDGGSVRAGAYMDGFVPAYSQTIDPAASNGEAGDVVLTRGTNLTGRVVTSDGQPIDFVQIDVTGGFGSSGGIYQRFNYPFPSAESSVDGNFQLPAIEPGSVTVRFTATDYVTKEQPFTASGPVMDVGDVEMESSDEPKEGRLAGLVITEEGKGLAGSNVYIRCLDCSTAHEALQNTDSQGRFSFENVTDGTYSIDVSGSTFRGNLWVPLSQRLGGARPGGDSVVLLYDMSHSIKAKLIDTAGNPIRRFQAGINVLDTSGGTNNEVRMRYETEMNTSDGMMTLPYLISGTANLSVSGGGTKDISSVYIAPTQTVIDLGEVVVSQGGTVDGYVVAEEGGGSLQGVTVEALPPDGAPASHPLNSLSFSTITGPTGEFDLSGLPEATIDVQFRKAGRVATRRRGIPITPGETAALGEVALPLAATIEGRITDSVSGLPISNVLINFNNWIVYSDREGKYRGDMIPPGDIAMIAIHNMAGDSHEKFAAQFVAPPGETTIYDFEMIPLQ